jgi:hypothetical protein
MGLRFDEPKIRRNRYEPKKKEEEEGLMGFDEWLTEKEWYGFDGSLVEIPVP